MKIMHTTNLTRKSMMDFLNNAPMVIVQNKPMTVYQGCLFILGEHFSINISLKDSESLKEATFSGDPTLNYLLKDYHSVLRQLMNQSPCLASFLKELSRLLERILEKHKHKQESLPSGSGFCKRLIQDISDVGWNKLVSVDDSFSLITLSLEDGAGRNHLLKLQIPKEYPSKAPKCDVDLPKSFAFQWNSKCNNIRYLYGLFRAEVNKYEDMWDQLEDIDRNTWVLEPEGVSYGVAYRRIALGNNASLHISVNPLHPRTFPDISFLGPDSVIAPLKQNLNNAVEEWDDKNLLVPNLECVLSVKFPTKLNMTKEEVQAECGICYSYRLDGFLPHETCENINCGQVFHQNCLYEWLRALPNSRQSFNTIFGDCPYCNKPTSVGMPAR